MTNLSSAHVAQLIELAFSDLEPLPELQTVLTTALLQAPLEEQDREAVQARLAEISWRRQLPGEALGVAILGGDWKPPDGGPWTGFSDQAMAFILRRLQSPDARTRYVAASVLLGLSMAVTQTLRQPPEDGEGSLLEVRQVIELMNRTNPNLNLFDWRPAVDYRFDGERIVERIEGPIAFDQPSEGLRGDLHEAQQDISPPVPPPPEQALESDLRPAYARLEAPAHATTGETFPLIVGLAPKPSPTTLQSSEFGVPHHDFTLTVQVVVDGFAIIGSSGTVLLDVTADDPYPMQMIRLLATENPELTRLRSVMAVYSIAGNTLAVATRVVEVLSAGTAPPASAPVQSGDSPGDGEDWALPTGDGPPADLTVIVKTGDDAKGRSLIWYLSSPIPDVPLPPAPIRTWLGDGLPEWIRRVSTGVDDRKDAEDLGEYLRGIAQIVADAVPGAVWTALRACAMMGGKPTLLLSTADPYLPWELAEVPQPWDPQAAPYLGAQCWMGRWIYREHGPAPAPPTSLKIGSLGVVRGSYAGAYRLPEAEAEADHLQERFGATVIAARKRPILNCLKGNPTVEALHVSTHGSVDASGYEDGILMEDDSYLDPISVRGVVESPVRLVFLNACTLGQGEEMLGNNAGMAAALIAIGAGAVIAPLWKVDDAVARDVATRFYSSLRTGHAQPARFAADERTTAVAAGEASPDGTKLAYLFFGHPQLKITWS